MAETTIDFDFDSLMRSRQGVSAGELDRERHLIEGLRQGTEQAYEFLIARYQQPVYNLVYRLVEDPGDADDVVQEVFLKIFRNVGTFRGQSSLKTWIYRITVNEAHNHRRWFSRHGKHEVGFETEEGAAGRSYRDLLAGPGESPYELALRRETRTLIEEALSRLKPIFREAVVLRDIEDLSYEEIAEVLQVSLGTVKSRILRGREALRKRLLGRLEKESTFGWSPQTAEQD